LSPQHDKVLSLCKLSYDLELKRVHPAPGLYRQAAFSSWSLLRGLSVSPRSYHKILEINFDGSAMEMIAKKSSG